MQITSYLNIGGKVLEKLLIGLTIIYTLTVY